jgi:hypothetical protein
MMAKYTRVLGERTRFYLLQRGRCFCQPDGGLPMCAEVP